MKGFPTHINTKADVLYLLQEYPAEMMAKLRDWLDNRYSWYSTGDLADGAAGIEDATHRVVDSDGIRTQQELREDSTSTLFRVGLTVAEAEEMIR
ncbi:MAG: hypothetical protein M0024_01330 [Nitrospiraceae bacterium]|nr:hypothetical protein [Nitrospiraceae bacterium]